MKKIFTVVILSLLLILLLSIFVACNGGQNDENRLETSTDGVVFSENSDGTYSVVDYIGTANAVTIAPTYNGKSVTQIDAWAFMDCANLKSVTIPDSVTHIDWWAFSDCTSLTSITVPDSVTSIGNNAFNNTAWFNNQPDGLVYIGKVAYKYKGTMATNTSISINAGTKGIADCAFDGCGGLTSITIPNSVSYVTESAFVDCTGISSITVSDGNAKYHSEGNCLIETAKKQLVLGCKTSVIPSDGCVEIIGESAFRDCTDITSVTIPNSVKSIGSRAFLNCADLATVNFGSGLTKIGSSAFSDCTALTQIIIPEGVKSIDGAAFEGCTSLSQITVPVSATIIDSGIFDNTAWYNSQPDGMVYIGKIAYGYKGIMPADTSITLSTDTTSIANRAFEKCENLIAITIPANVVYIGEYTFLECKGLSLITVAGGNAKYNSNGNCLIETSNKKLILGCKNSVIPTDGSVSIIGECAFRNCIGLTDIIIPSGVTVIEDSAFSECEALETITLGSDVTSIGNSAFYNCSSLTSITIPNSITEINEIAFYGCTSLTEVTIPSQIANIEVFAFANCTGLATITVAEGNTKYHSANNCIIETASKTLIAGCKTSVIPTDGSVTSIATGAFDHCTDLTSITIPSSVTSIEDSAFFACTNLDNIIFENQSCWYATTSDLLFQNRIGGTAIDTSVSSANATRMTADIYEYYYKLNK